MKDVSFEKMEAINGGRCTKQAIYMYGGLIATVGSIGVPFMVAWGAAFTAAAYYDYVKCLELI